MTDRARRMADATRLPQHDRRAAGAEGAIAAGGVRMPRAGTADVLVDGRSLRLTNLDRVLWPETGFTKAELVAYWLGVADVALPHLRSRPLTAGRFPGGVDGRGFAATELPGRPEWIAAVPLLLANGAVRRFTLVDERAALVWLAQMGTIELHAFLGALPDLERPTAVVFDLDPSGPDGLLAAADVALALRERLARIGLVAFAKTSGSAGMHVLVPVGGGASYGETREFATRLAADLARERPDRVTDRMARDARAGRVLVDVRQNARRLTTVAAYSPRATPRPTVSAPLAWDEVEAAVARRDAGALVVETTAMPARVARVGDPLAAIGTRSQTLR
jgi:bifunctional non-homologous end joining protein LigD